MQNPIITLLSDFGLRDPYVAEMKAVILSICPTASIVDISHEIPKFNISIGAYILAKTTPYFPKGTIHVAVVDPGVGTKRRALIIETERSLYIGPDNGLLILSTQREKMKQIREIINPKYMHKQISSTFHGRDVFCPVAAHIAKEVPIADFGPKISDPEKPSFSEPIVKKRSITGEILYIDGFGNLITNIRKETLKTIGVEPGEDMVVILKTKRLSLKLSHAYGELSRNLPLSLIDSSGFLEISINQGNAAKRFTIKIGDTVQIMSIF